MLFDFTENESGTKNFSIIEPAEFSILEKPVEGMAQKPTLVFPYAERYGGTLQGNEIFESRDESI